MSQPRTGGAPPAGPTAPELDPTTPQGKAAADQMRKLLQEQGVPANQIEARIADVFARAQQPLPAPPKPESSTKQPAPGLGEQLGDAFNDFTNEVHEGFYDRLDQTVGSAEQTLHTAQNLTGTGGDGRPGVMDSWKQVFEDNAKSVLSDPLRAMAGPGNPLAEFGAVPGELSRAIDNPGHYVGEKLFDGTAIAATAPLGGEGALGRALFPELRAAEHGVLPEVTHGATPGIPHNVVDLPPAVEHPLGSPLGGSHDLPSVGDHSPPAGHLPPHGDPGSYGYDVDGNRLPYANGGRPDFAPNQVEDTWHISRNEQLGQIGDGLLDLPKPGSDQQWVLLHPDGPTGADWTVENGHRLIEWQPGDPRKGLWDMGHVPGEEYRISKDEYLTGNLTYEDFLDLYRDPNNYRVQDPYRNRSHIDEGP